MALPIGTAPILSCASFPQSQTLRDQMTQLTAWQVASSAWGRGGTATAVAVNWGVLSSIFQGAMLSLPSSTLKSTLTVNLPFNLPCLKAKAPPVLGRPMELIVDAEKRGLVLLRLSLFFGEGPGRTCRPSKKNNKQFRKLSKNIQKTSNQ